MRRAAGTAIRESYRRETPRSVSRIAPPLFSVFSQIPTCSAPRLARYRSRPARKPLQRPSSPRSVLLPPRPRPYRGRIAHVPIRLPSLPRTARIAFRPLSRCIREPGDSRPPRGGSRRPSARSASLSGGGPLLPSGGPRTPPFASSGPLSAPASCPPRGVRLPPSSCPARTGLRLAPDRGALPQPILLFCTVSKERIDSALISSRIARIDRPIQY